MSLFDRMKKASKSDMAAAINDSEIFGREDWIPTAVPALNIALSGDVDKGLASGVTVIAAPSKHFKTGFSLVMAQAFQKKYDDGIVLFLDSEYGSPPDYFKAAGVDMNRVLHIPIENVEGCKIELVNQLQELRRSDNVMIIIDSLGNLASLKETQDALDGKTTVDMTRAKAIKSLFRIITPMLKIRNIPLVAVGHTYKTQEMYSKDVIGGGTGMMYSADTALIIGRRTNKDNKEDKKQVTGYDFVIKVEKSRFVREGTSVPISIDFDEGIEKWSGLLDIALEGGYATKPSVGWFQPANPETGEVFGEQKYRRADTNTEAFWNTVFEKTDFRAYINRRYKVSNNTLMKETANDQEATEPVS